ncbi:Pentatricopeptide repeat-containing protein, partial [Cucurbita argyrosperma subsp. sororia]
MESYKSLLDRQFKMIPATCNVLLEVLLKHGKKTEALGPYLIRCWITTLAPNFQAVNSDTFNIMVNECFKLGKSPKQCRDFPGRVFGELIKNGKVVDCAQILTKMGERDPKPDPTCYDVVIRGLCNEGALDASRELLDQIMRYGIGLTPTLQEFVKEAFVKAGRSEEIERLLNMNRWGHAPYRSSLDPHGYHNRRYHLKWDLLIRHLHTGHPPMAEPHWRPSYKPSSGRKLWPFITSEMTGPQETLANGRTTLAAFHKPSSRRKLWPFITSNDRSSRTHANGRTTLAAFHKPSSGRKLWSFITSNDRS